MTLNVGGSKVSISFFFFFTVCVSLVLDKTNTAVLALCAAAVHEGGHLLCMLWFGEKPGCVCVAPFGLSITRFPRGGYKREMCIALAGPCANLLLAGVMLVLIKACDMPNLKKAVVVNISIAVFNLLPIEPLDCGRAIYCFLCERADSVRAQRAVFCVGVIVLVPMTACGFYVLIKSRYNITLLLASIYLSYMLLKKRQY